jgi:LPS sulfotransferase NodH
LNFVIVATRRTGSSYLTGLLRHQPDVFCHGEIFNVARVQGQKTAPRWKIENEAELLALRATDPAAFLARFGEIKFGRAIVGFKMMATHDPQMMAHILGDPAIRKIVLSRQNLLAQYASDVAALQTKEYGGKAEKPLVRFRGKRFERFIERTRGFYERTEETLRTSGQEYLALRFDQINDAASIAGLLKFIGSEAGSPIFQAPPANRASADVLSRFDNPDIALAWLEQHGLAHWRLENERQPQISS